jgi:hypothetical protein
LAVLAASVVLRRVKELISLFHIYKIWPRIDVQFSLNQAPLRVYNNGCFRLAIDAKA